MLQHYDERNKDLLVNINGELIHRDKAGISPFDSAVQGGDAVWEGLRLYQGKIFRLYMHLDRLHDSATALAFASIPSHEELAAEIRRTLQANQMTDGVHIRLTLSRGVKYTSGMDPRVNTRGHTLIVLAEHKAPVYEKKGIRLITSGYRRPGPDVLDPRIHHNNLLNSILAKIQANASGADDALMLDGRGFVAETNATHFFIVRGGVIHTPHTHACPEGITRGAVLDLCARHHLPHEIRDLTLAEVYRADEAFCTGTMGEVVPVIEVDGRPIGDSKPGPTTAKICRFFEQLVKNEGDLIL